jgi:hypothetical protein
LQASLGIEGTKKLELEAAQMEAHIKEDIVGKYNKETHRESLLTEISNIRDRILADINQQQ